MKHLGKLKKSIVDPELLKILACPICKSDVRIEGQDLRCINCRANYPIYDDIPIMIIKDNEQYKHQREYFGKEFKDYKQYRLENWRISFLKRIFEVLEIRSNSNLESKNDLYLDIGVGGSGYTVIEAAKKGIRSIGIDLSLIGIQHAKKFATQQGAESLCNFVVSSAEALPFKNESFSKISSIAVLEHITDDKQAIAEIARVAKPNGKIFINVPNTYQRMFPLLWLPYKIHDKKIGHLRHYQAENLVEKFSKFGLILKNLQYTGHLIKVLQVLLSLFFPALRKKDSKLWWRLEEMDSKGKSSFGLQINLALRKVGENI